MNSFIKQKRIELGLTLEEVADICNVGKSTVRKWENGIIQDMGRSKIVLLAKALQISPLELLEPMDFESTENDFPKESEIGDNKLKLVDTEDEFSLTIGDKEIPYITKYSITSNVYGTMELDLKLTIPREIILIADKQIR